MEASAGVTAGRGVSTSMSSSQAARKEWRAVSEHSVRNTTNEEFERSKLGQSDERTIYEEFERSKLGQSDERTIYEVQQCTGPGHVDFCSIRMGGSLDSGDLLQPRLHSVVRQREELQQLELDLRVQIIARSEIMEMQNGFDAQIKEHVNAAIELQEQLQEREQTIRELEREMEEKDSELRAIKIDNEAAWAKEDLLREQNKELANFQRELDNSEAERTQHLEQMHELQEHIQEKERQFLELENQNRVAQETILYKDKQLRDAQAWIARVQEMDALQSTTNHSLQAELHERTERFNQFWLGFHRQFAEMERHHLHTIQQLQLELAEARARSGTYDESLMTRANSKDATPFVQNKGNQLDVNEGGRLSGNSEVVPNGSADAFLPFVSTGNGSTNGGLQANHIPRVPFVSSSLLGMDAYFPSGQVTALHPFVVHQHGVPHSVPSANLHVPQSHVSHLQPVPPISSHQHWHNQQALSEGAQISNHDQYQSSQTEQNLLRSDVQYNYELSMNGQAMHSDYMNVQISQGQEPGSVITTTNEEVQSHQNLREISAQFHEALGLDSSEQNIETKVQGKSVVTSANHSLNAHGLTPSTAPDTSPSITLHPANIGESIDNRISSAILPETSISAVQTSNLPILGKIPEPTLLDERSLLACIVRAIPAGSGGRIRISCTLPNRLGKMLAPLHWHDYKKKYGKLEDFVSGHPELFVIEEDIIQLRDGAQEIIAATAAIAKVAAAASAPCSSMLTSVAVTPMAQTPHRLKKFPSIDLKPMKTISMEHAIAPPASTCDKASQLSAMHNQHSNGLCFNKVQGFSNIKILTKSKNHQELNGLLSENRPGDSSVHNPVGNGVNLNRTVSGSFQNKGSNSGRHSTNFGGKQQGRTSGR